ncbi:PPE domain-containing protein, partial [Mycobacterium tuberculosis]
MYATPEFWNSDGEPATDVVAEFVTGDLVLAQFAAESGIQAEVSAQMHLEAFDGAAVSVRMFTGAGSAPMLAAAVAWDGLAAELGSAASSFGSV